MDPSESEGSDQEEFQSKLAPIHQQIKRILESDDEPAAPKRQRIRPTATQSRGAHTVHFPIASPTDEELDRAEAAEQQAISQPPSSQNRADVLRFRAPPLPQTNPGYVRQQPPAGPKGASASNADPARIPTWANVAANRKQPPLPAPSARGFVQLAPKARPEPSRGFLSVLGAVRAKAGTAPSEPERTRASFFPQRQQAARQQTLLASSRPGSAIRR